MTKNPIAETDASGNVVSLFVYGTSALSPDCMIKDGTTYRFIRDFQGSVRLVVDAATGAVAQRLDYDSFGRVLADTAPGFQPFGFQSGLYDPDTGLVHFGARWYDASTGRWLSKDPILLEGGLNLYAFCGNDPVNFVDPLGLCEVVKDGGEYVNKYVNDLSKHPFNPFYVKGVVGENDIWRHKDDGIVYSYRDFIYAPDEMGNIGPAYAATMAWGPLNATGAMAVEGLAR